MPNRVCVFAFIAIYCQKYFCKKSCVKSTYSYRLFFLKGILKIFLLKLTRCSLRFINEMTTRAVCVLRGEVVSGVVFFTQEGNGPVTVEGEIKGLKQGT
jgi:hypothetical protein